MANFKIEKMKRENELMKKLLTTAQEEVNSLKDVMFAFVKMHGRVRVPRDVAETLREDDNVKMERQQNGDWVFEFIAGSKEVKPASEIETLGGKKGVLLS